MHIETYLEITLKRLVEQRETIYQDCSLIKFIVISVIQFETTNTTIYERPAEYENKSKYYKNNDKQRKK
jgi:hypothetical protein